MSSEFTPAPEQPYQVEIHTDDDLYIRHVTVQKAQTYLPQHSHAFGHYTLISYGAVRVWRGSEEIGVYRAPAVVYIDAATKHVFLTLEDNTVLACIHNLHGAETVKVLEENALVA